MKKTLKIVLDKDYLNLVDINSNKEEYSILLAYLGSKIEGNLSEHILHLAEKPIIRIKTLYSLAKIINEKVPTNGIDWYSTFYSIENSEYRENIYDALNFQKKETIIEKVVGEIFMDPDEDSQQIVDQIVKKRLKEYDL